MDGYARDVSALVAKRPGKPVHSSLESLAACPLV